VNRILGVRWGSTGEGPTSGTEQSSSILSRFTISEAVSSGAVKADAQYGFEVASNGLTGIRGDTGAIILID
jgi:hypothetical protein